MAAINDLIKTAPVVVFGKKSCPFCKKVQGLLKELLKKKEDVKIYDIVEDSSLFGPLSAFTQLQTVPQVFVNGELIGGCDDTHALHARGELVPKLTEAVRQFGQRKRGRASSDAPSAKRTLNNSVARAEELLLRIAKELDNADHGGSVITIANDFDKNKDRLLQREEFDQFLTAVCKLININPTSEDHGLLFSHFDEDGSGEVDYFEFITTLKTIRTRASSPATPVQPPKPQPITPATKLRAEELLRIIARRLRDSDHGGSVITIAHDFDSNQDHKLDRQEFRQLVDAVCQLVGLKADEQDHLALFHTFDINGNGSIDYFEFILAVRKNEGDDTAPVQLPPTPPTAQEVVARLLAALKSNSAPAKAIQEYVRSRGLDAKLVISLNAFGELAEETARASGVHVSRSDVEQLSAHYERPKGWVEYRSFLRDVGVEMTQWVGAANRVIAMGAAKDLLARIARHVKSLDHGGSVISIAADYDKDKDKILQKDEFFLFLDHVCGRTGLHLDMEQKRSLYNLFDLDHNGGIDYFEFIVTINQHSDVGI